MQHIHLRFYFDLDDKDNGHPTFEVFCGKMKELFPEFFVETAFDAIRYYSRLHLRKDRIIICIDDIMEKKDEAPFLFYWINNLLYDTDITVVTSTTHKKVLVTDKRTGLISDERPIHWIRLPPLPPLPLSPPPPPPAQTVDRVAE